MNGSSQLRIQLATLARSWETSGRRSPATFYPYQEVLDEILFHSDLRFGDYLPFHDEDDFPARLLKWLQNVQDGPQRRALFALLPHITFVDRLQMRSLQRDALRRIITPWVSRGRLTARDTLAPDYRQRVLGLLRQYHFFSITESFNFPEFQQLNQLTGLPRPRTLSEDLDVARTHIARVSDNCEGIIVLEDFVGTGRQAGDVLQLFPATNPRWRVLFVPLIMLEGATTEIGKRAPSISISAVHPVPRRQCVLVDHTDGESTEFATFRALAGATSDQVLERLDEHDDPPDSAFGYRGSGALLVTCHNAPNNTLALIHHRAPRWEPLFRRLHHGKEA